MKKPLAIGISDYKEIIETHCSYVDKTMLIHELLSHREKVTLLCRPRRFGKTLNLSMLKYFFEKSPLPHKHLFVNQRIWQFPALQEHQGQYPVIFISFKGVKQPTFIEASQKIISLIIQQYEYHISLLAPSLTAYQLNRVNRLIEGTASNVDYGDSLRFLTELLYSHYQTKTMVLLDEYDTPLHEAFVHGYYDEMVTFIKSLFGELLKDNIHLERAVLTGILRTAKAGVFSDLNNLLVCTMMRNDYTDKFGFTHNEVVQLLHEHESEQSIQAITDWYNGYRVGDTTLVYNPWSILECIRNQSRLETYWVNTSNNELIKKSIASANGGIKKELELLLHDHPEQLVVKQIDEGFTFQEITSNDNALWSLLLLSGYLTFSDKILSPTTGQYVATLTLPNREVKTLYTNILRTLFSQNLNGHSKATELLQALIQGDTTSVQSLLQLFVVNSMSYYDIAPQEPERSYHLFVLGMVTTFDHAYQVCSNKESGYGRYDVMLFPHTTTLPGILIEFKKATQASLQKSALTALQQMKNQHYAQEFGARGAIKPVSLIMYGIAFEGKRVWVESEHITLD